MTVFLLIYRTIFSNLSTRHPHLFAIVRLVRLSNSLSASALVLTGAYLAGAAPFSASVWKAVFAMWCVTAFGYASNDLFDITEDAINKPDRPLPSGSVTRRTVQALITALAVAASLISWSIGWLPVAVAISIMALLIVYNVRLKGRPLQGNFLIGSLAGCTLLVGGVAAQGLSFATVLVLLPPSLILAAFVSTREILKTIEDEAGDLIARKVTITTQRNSQAAIRIVTGSALITIGLLFLPIWLHNYSLTYLLVALLGVGGPLLYTVLFLRANQDVWRVRRCLALLKGSYFAGILALWLA